jgi:hypothetical protein
MQTRRIALFLLLALSVAPALRAGIEQIDLRVQGMT